MRICLAQVKPFKGDVDRNIALHTKMIALAVEHGSRMIFFPELSLTGYEPTLANQLAADSNDRRFDVFQSVSDEYNIVIAAGMPTKSETGIRISMLAFQPNLPRQVYSKQH